MGQRSKYQLLLAQNTCKSTIYAELVRGIPHADSVARSCDQWPGEHYRETGAIKQIVELASMPERP